MRKQGAHVFFFFLFSKTTVFSEMGATTKWDDLRQLAKGLDEAREIVDGCVHGYQVQFWAATAKRSRRKFDGVVYGWVQLYKGCASLLWKSVHCTSESGETLKI